VLAQRKVVRHQFMRPFGLPDCRTVGSELDEDLFDVQHWRTVESVQALHSQSRPLNRDQPTDGRGNSIRPCFSALGEDSYLKPVWIAARVPAPGDDRIFAYPCR